MSIKLSNDNCKICHLSSAHTRYDARILYRECVSLKEHGYDVTFIVNDGMPEETVNGVRIVSSKSGNRENRIRRMLIGTRSVYKKSLEVDAVLYHLHDPELLGIANKLIKRGKRVVFDSHENYYEQIRIKKYLPTFFRKIIAAFYYKYETYICKRIDGVVIPASTKEDSSFGKRCKRIALVDNLPKIDEFQNHNLVIKPYAERKGICYSGSLTYERGIAHLAEAAFKSGVTLTLAGRFENDEFMNDIINGQYGKNIRYLGFLDRENTYKMYNESAIGISTLLDVGQYSKADNLPTKVYEYMAMRLPVILSDFPYYRKTVKEYKYGLVVNPADIEDITKKIKYLISNTQEAEQMGLNGANAVIEKFNWTVAEKELITLYAEILGQKG